MTTTPTPQPEPVTTNLHAQIMNLQAKPYDGTTTYDAYVKGHRDARHAAADLVAAAEAAQAQPAAVPDVERLREDLRSADAENDRLKDMLRRRGCRPACINAQPAAAVPAPDVPEIDYRGALQDLCDEFRRVFPIYYYAEPWAHDRNAVLQHALLLLAAGKRLAAPADPLAQPQQGGGA